MSPVWRFAGFAWFALALTGCGQKFEEVEVEIG